MSKLLFKKEFTRRDGVKMNISLYSKKEKPKKMSLSKANYNINDISSKRDKALKKVISNRGKEYVKKQLEKRLQTSKKDVKKKYKTDLRKI